MAPMPMRPVPKCDLRDPTLEELYTGPVRALPEEIQQLPEEDTACTFCGVSYFVFAEVQTLQSTVKQHKKTFRDLVRFLEHERSDASKLRQQVIELKSKFATLVGACSTSIKQFSEQNTAQGIAKQEALNQVVRLQKELVDLKVNCHDLQILSQRMEKDQEAHALIERELRNEISQVSIQAESYQSQLKSQQATFDKKLDRAQQNIRELESKCDQWTTTEKQIGAERNELVQKLQTMNKRAELESSSVVHLNNQLAALREELGRIVAATDSERESSLSDILDLKHQIERSELMRSQLGNENARYKDEKYKLEDEVTALRLAADQLHGKLSVSTKFTEKVKDDYSRDLGKVREEYKDEIYRLQQDHAQAIKEFIANQNERLECVKQDTAKLESQRKETLREALSAMQHQLHDAERRANEWKDRALQNASEREEAKRKESHFETLNQTLQNRLATSELDKQKALEEANKQRAELEQRLKRVELRTRQEMNALHQEATNRQQLVQDENTALQQQLAHLQYKLSRLQAQSNIDFQPKVAWQSNEPENRKTSRHISSNQDCHENEFIIEQLQDKVKQKDREIALLQQTVHRECMERTSLLERIRGGKVKVLPETGITRTSSSSVVLSDRNDADDSNDCLEQNAKLPKASFYEKLRRAGSRKAKPKR